MNNLIHRCPLMQKNNRLISFGTQTNGNVFMNWESFLLPSDCRKIDCHQFVKQNSVPLCVAAASLKMDVKAHVAALTSSIR